MTPASLGIVLVLSLRVEDVRMLRRTMRDPNEEFILFRAGIWDFADLQVGALLCELADLDRLHSGEVMGSIFCTFIRKRVKHMVVRVAEVVRFEVQKSVSGSCADGPDISDSRAISF